MKRYLLLFAIMAVGAFSFKAHSQACDLALSGLQLTVTNRVEVVGGCEITFDLEFYIADNGGNKQIYINLWNAASYNTGAGEYNWTSNSAKMPTYAQMDGLAGGHGPIAVIGIDNTPATPQKLFVPYYSGDNANINYTNKRLVQGTSVTRTYDAGLGKSLFEATGLKMIVPCGAFALKGNIWGSQTQIGNIGANPSIHCYDDQFDFNVGDVSIREAILNCTNKQVQLLLDVSGSQTFNVTYQFLVDSDNDGYDEDDPTGYGPAGPYPVADVNDPAADYNSNWLQLGEPWQSQTVFRHTVYAEVNYTSAVGSVTLRVPMSNGCATLPVKFQSFTAARNKNNVAIKWETSTEINNRGFYIQRNINGSWENIAFVFSQADNGNSNSVLSYSYNDLNTTKGVTQYRIQQVDLDGKARYSEIRSVRGEANISKLLVYPNPTTSGNVNVVFEDQMPKNVSVLDMSGRMIKQYRNVINNVSVDNLENGIYSIQVTDVSTATISVEKVVVKKR